MLPLRGSSLSLRGDANRPVNGSHSRNVSDASRSDGGRSAVNGNVAFPNEDGSSPQDSSPSSPQPKIRRLSPSPSQALSVRRLSAVSDQSESGPSDEAVSSPSDGEDHSKRLEELMRCVA